MLSTIFFATARNKFKAAFYKDDINNKKIILLLSLILEATFYTLNVNLRKGLGTIIPNIALDHFFHNKYKDITFAISSSSKELRTFVSNYILNPSTISYYDQMLSWIKLQYELIYFPYIIKSTSPSKNLLHKNIKAINKGITKFLNTVSEPSTKNKKITDRLLTSLFVVVGDLLFPGSDSNLFIGSHESFSPSLFSNTNLLNTQNTPNKQNLSTPSLKITWSLWDLLMDSIIY
jgi:hypothetical protein